MAIAPIKQPVELGIVVEAVAKVKEIVLVESTTDRRDVFNLKLKVLVLVTGCPPLFHELGEAILLRGREEAIAVEAPEGEVGGSTGIRALIVEGFSGGFADRGEVAGDGLVGGVTIGVGDGEDGNGGHGVGL